MKLMKVFQVNEQNLQRLLSLFLLNLQQRGKEKEEEFMKRVQETMIEEERQRIPIAQGLPWTTDEPQVKRSSNLFIC